MKLRSIVFDLFGEYIRYDGGEIGLRALVELLAPFGISEDVVRVLMARLRKEGWFESSRVGRQSRYSLTDEGWHLLDTGRERIFERPPEPWPGEWCMAIYSIPESARASRDRLRKLLSWLGFGPLAASAWISPHDRRDQVSEAWKDESDGRLQLLMARSGGLDEDRDPLWVRGPFLTYDGEHDDGIIVVHGHTPRSEAELLGNRIGIDTGAYFSGRLTCVQLMGERLRLIQVSDH